MDEFQRLMNVANRLLGPGGCPWDQEQTYESLRGCILEELYELIEAVDLKDYQTMREELGDLYFNLIFYCKIAEKEAHFTTAEVLNEVAEKLIRRHPHVYGDVKLEHQEQLFDQWERIKREEKKGKRKSALDDVPKDLPALARAAKVLKKFDKLKFAPQKIHLEDAEESIGQELLDLVRRARTLGVNPELALRKILARTEADFRAQEFPPENNPSTKD